MDLYTIISIMLKDFPQITTLIGSLLFGEEAVIILGFLAGLGLLSIKSLMIFGTIGSFLSDLFWFIIGKTAFKESERKGSMHKRYHFFMKYIDRVTHNHFMALLLTRFFYFFRLFAIVHLSRKGMPWKKFLLYEIPIIIVWMIVFVSIGWTFGNTALVYLHVVGRIEKVVIAVAALILMLLLIKSLVSRVIEKYN